MFWALSERIVSAPPGRHVEPAHQRRQLVRADTGRGLDDRLAEAAVG